MIWCVLLVSNSQGCCLAAPGDHEGAAIIHTQSCLIPIITWCHHFFHNNQYYAHEKQFKVWMESNRNFRCHVTTLSWRQVSQSPPPPVTKMRMPVFCGRLGVWNQTAPDRVICYPWRQRSWSCGVFTSWIPYAHCPFQWKWQFLHNYDISVLQQVGMFFDGIACLMKIWPLFKREFSRVPMTWRSARARVNFKCDAADVDKQIRTDFRGVKCVSGECHQPYRENIRDI